MPQLIAFLGVALAIWVLRPFALRAGLADLPGGRRQHADAVPLVGGVAIALGIAVALALRDSLAPASPALLAAGLIVTVAGVADDFIELSARAKLMFQMIAASVLAGVGGVLVLHVGALFSPSAVTLGVMSVVPFTLLGMVGVMNAMNMIDGADGLAGGVALSALLWFGTAAWLAGLASHVSLIGLFACAIAAYLCFNAGGPLARRCKIFLGDAGSLLTGLMLAWLAITLAMEPYAAFKPVTAVWILAVPICDSVSLMLRRVLRGRSPFKPDREHLHHLLQDAGLTSAQAVALLVTINLLLGGAALLADRMQVPEHWMFYLSMLIFAGYTIFAARFFARRRAQ